LGFTIDTIQVYPQLVSEEIRNPFHSVSCGDTHAMALCGFDTHYHEPTICYGWGMNDVG